MKQRLLSVMLCVMMVFTVVTPITVMADYSDYVPGEMPADIIKDGWIYGNTNSGSVSFGWSNGYGSDTQYKVKSDVTYDSAATWAAHGTLVNSANVNGGTALDSNTTYVFSAKFRNAGEEGTTPRFTVYYHGNQSKVFPNEYGTDGWTPGSEHTDYNITFNTGSNTSGSLVYGIISAKKDDIVHMNYKNGMYLAKEVAYDITNVVTGSAELLAGESTTIKTELVNQIGTKGTLEQNFTYTVLNEGRTATVDGITVTPGENGEATVEVAFTVASGKYVILAESDDYAGFRKGAQITVENQQLINDTIGYIKAESAEELAGNLETYLDTLSITDDYVLEADVTELAAVIAGGVADETISTKEDMQEYIRKCAVVALYDVPSEDVELYDENGSFIYADVLKLEDIDAYQAKEYVTNDGMLLVQQALTGKDFASYGEFAKSVASEIILKAISHSNKDGVEYLNEVLSEENLTYIDVEAAAFLGLNNNVQFLRNDIKGKSFTLTTLAETLATAYESDMAALNADYVPGEVKGSFFVKYPSNNINLYTTNNGTGGTMYRGEGNSYDAQKMYGLTEKSDGASSYFTAGPVYLTTGNERISESIVKGKTYAVAVRLKNGTPEKKATLKAAIAYSTGIAPAVRWDVTSSEFVTYTGTFTATKDATNIGLGFDATVDRSAVTDADRGMLLIDYSDKYTYMGEEYVYDMAITADKVKVEAGTTLNLTAKAVNQVGDEYTSAAPAFNYHALNEDRTDTAAGFAFIPSKDTKTAVVEVDVNTEPGTYVLMAEDTSLGVEGFKKGVTVEVTKPVIRDTEAGSKNINISVTEGGTTVGVFDETVFAASVADGSGAPVAGTYEFNWYVLNEERTDKVEEGFVLTPSSDTKTVALSLKPEVAEGNYYVVAETGDLRKSMALTVDKTNDIAVIISNITEKPDKFTEDIETVVKLLELNNTYVSKANGAELASVVIAGAGNEALTDKATLTEYIKRASLVALYNIPTEDVALSDDKGNFTYEKELGLHKIDSDGITLYSGAMIEMSDQGKIKLHSSLKGQDFATYGDFIKTAKENLLLIAIANPKDDGIAYLDTLLTEENLKSVGIENSDYFDIDDASDFLANKVLKQEFTIKTLESTLNDAYETETEDDDSDGGSRGPSGGSSMSFGGASKNDDKKEVISQNTEFADVSKTHWAYSDIHYLRNIGVINGTTETTYEPEAVVTREQFLKILIEAFKLGTSGNVTSFGDVDANSWYAPYVSGGIANGIITGKSATEFGVGEAVTRQDACVMIDRALSLSGEISEEVSFKDGGEIAEYAKASVATLAGYGIVNGMGDGTFSPKTVCTRAQAAKIISNALSICNSLNLNGR